MPLNKMKLHHGMKLAVGQTGCSRPTVVRTTMSNGNNAHGKTVAFRNGGIRFFNLIATILFATIMIVNVRHSCGLIEIQTEKEKHGEYTSLYSIVF